MTSQKRQREESMIGKLITEVKDQSNLRIDQQQKLGQQEEKLKNLQRKVEELTEENSKLKDESHRFRNMLVKLWFTIILKLFYANFFRKTLLFFESFFSAKTIWKFPCL